MWSSGSSCVRFALVFAEEKTPSTPSMSLTPPSARQLPTWISLPIRLSWASPALIPASGSIPCVHSRSAGKSHLPSVCRLHPLHIAFRPRGFSPPRRLAPLGGSGMLQPDPDRVRCVSRRLPSLACFVTRRSRSKRSSCTRRSSQRGSYPSKHSPRRQPYRITAAFAFLPLSSPTRVVVLPKQSRPGGS
jgi:hypothetical protein